MAIHNPTHEDLDWLRRDVLPAMIILELSGRPESPLEETPLIGEMNAQTLSQTLLQMTKK